MKQKIVRTVLAAVLIVLLILTNIPFEGRSGTKAFTLPGLPRPLAKAPFAITSAGQSTNTYIIRDISNQLMLRNYFMPQAKDSDLKDINAIVFVVGYSSLGMKLQNISYEGEKERISKLLDKAKDNELKVITVVICGGQAQDNETEEFLKLIGPETDYLIGLKDSSKESVLMQLARDRDIPLTLVGSVKDIAEPFASAFR